MEFFKKRFIGKVFLVLLGIIIVALSIRYLPEIIKLTVSLDRFREYVISTGHLGPLTIIVFQILQTIIAPIPGEVVQIAGGYIYGVSLGTFYVTVGMLLGAVAAFYFTRFLGGEYIEKLIKRDKFQWISVMTDNKKFSIFLFIVFLIPGLPKDMFIYAAGLTTIKPLRFFTIFLIARFPALLASVCVGSNMYQKDYLSTIVISVVSILAFILGLIYKDKIMNKLNKLSVSENKEQ